MKTFQPHGLLCDYNTIEQYGLNIDGFIKMMEYQAAFDAISIYSDEFESYSDYEDYVEPLNQTSGEEAVNAAINYISSFFYFKGAKDSARIRDRIFK